jgi:hypothetical protein
VPGLVFPQCSLEVDDVNRLFRSLSASARWATQDLHEERSVTRVATARLMNSPDATRPPFFTSRMSAVTFRFVRRPLTHVCSRSGFGFAGPTALDQEAPST